VQLLDVQSRCSYAMLWPCYVSSDIVCVSILINVLFSTSSKSPSSVFTTSLSLLPLFSSGGMVPITSNVVPFFQCFDFFFGPKDFYRIVTPIRHLDTPCLI